MAPVRPPLAPQALRAYGNAQGIARSLSQPPAQAFDARAQNPSQSAQPLEGSKPAAGAQRPADGPPPFSLKTLSAFAGLLVGEQAAATSAKAPESPPAPAVSSEPTIEVRRPKPPGSTLDLKI